MSITCRLWSKKDLEDIKSSENPLLSTIFMNCSTFSEKEIKYYPYEARRVYLVSFKGQEEPIKVYAVNDKALFAFLNLEYIQDSVISVHEEKTKYKYVKFPEKVKK